MYCEGERMVYGVHGVCRVAAQEERTVNREKKSFLILEPEGQPGTRFMVPMQNPSAMAKLHPLLTPEEMASLLSSEQVHTARWIVDEGQRKQLYRELLGSGDREQLMQMVHTLYLHREKQTAAGKRCHVADEFFLRDAEKLLVGEMSVVLGISQESAKDRLQKELS